MRNVTRREWLAGLSAAAALGLGNRAAAQQPAPQGPFRLAPLPYANDALAPHIDAETMRIHHDLHHAAYVNNLNTAIAGHEELGRMSIEELLRNIQQVPMAIRQRVINNGGGHFNHTMFWEIMGPNAGGQPAGNLAQAINSRFESFDAFKRAFKQAALDRFGSGWAWLVLGEGNRLEIVSTQNQDCPLMTGQKPVLGLDVWEHAYYISYRNRRPDYVDAWWNVVNWTAVATRFANAMR